MTSTSLWLAAVAATVVLDPGHGGREDGAEGRAGTLEKQVTLGIARAARDALVDAGIEVVLTRDDDRDVALEDRIALAHRLEAAAFLSIHLNSSPAQGRRGLETYVASVSEIEGDAADLVAREEPASTRRPRPFGRPIERILDDLNTQAAHQRSAVLAAALRSALRGEAELQPDRGVRQAPFHVLVAARVPAVLLECGYVTHEEQERFFATRDGQRRVGRRIAEGILAFLRR